MSAAHTQAFAPHPQPAAGLGAAGGAGDTGSAGGAEAKGTRAEAAAPLGWLATLLSMAGELPGLVSDRLELLTLELQRSARALAQIVVLLVAVSILGVTAWLALWVGVGIGLFELGLHWALSLAVVLALNVGAALLASLRMRALLPLLRLPATRRHLRPGRVEGRDASPTASPPPPAAPAASTATVAPGASAGTTTARPTH